MKYATTAFLGLGLMTVTPAIAQDGGGAPVSAEQDANQAANDHLQAIESAGAQPLESVVSDFEERRFSPAFLSETTPEARRALLSRMREAAAQTGGAGIDVDSEGYTLTLSGSTVFEVRMTVSDEAPFRITSLTVDEVAEMEPLSLATLEADIDGFMAENNRTGVVFIAIDGETVLAKPYGAANTELGVPNSLDTIFGVGSRPIDFTIAAIYLLEQRGRLGLDDTLADHFENVPTDRADMSIEQMLTGSSGLPDFPARPEEDWDADLGWIDRATFEQRTMEVPLLFAPGENRVHSHWAFGVLAAIVERTSEQSYYAFLRENFFDPAEMTRTGNYGERRNLQLSDFAVGGGNQVGLPNIPPNWGPTSWLVMGSGGMYSSLGDLRRFYEYVTQSGVLEQRHAAYFLGSQAHVDGSERGFELFSYSDEERSDEAYVFLNSGGGPGALRPIIRPLVDFIRNN